MSKVLHMQGTQANPAEVPFPCITSTVCCGGILQRHANMLIKLSEKSSLSELIREKPIGTCM